MSGLKLTTHSILSVNRQRGTNLACEQAPNEASIVHSPNSSGLRSQNFSQEALPCIEIEAA